VTPHGFQLVEMADAAERFTFAYISDTHLYPRALNDRFVRAILKAVDDVNNLQPQPDSSSWAATWRSSPEGRARPRPEYPEGRQSADPDDGRGARLVPRHGEYWSRCSARSTTPSITRVSTS